MIQALLECPLLAGARHFLGIFFAKKKMTKKCLAPASSRKCKYSSNKIGGLAKYV